MSRPTPFQIMRRNRPKLHRAREEAEEREVEWAWDELREQTRIDRAAAYLDTADWLRDTRDQARAATGAPRPQPRRWFQIIRRPAWL